MPFKRLSRVTGGLCDPAGAGAVKGELLDSDNDMVRDRASTFVLGLADIAPASALSVDIDKSWLRHRPHG